MRRWFNEDMKMSKRGFKEPSVPKTLFPVHDGLALLQEAKAQELEIVRREISGIYLTRFDGSGLSFQQTVFQNCRFMGCNFNETFFKDVKFINCDFYQSGFSDAGFKNCAFLSCKGDGADFYGSSMYHVSFQDCVMKEALFDAGKMSYVKGSHTDFSKSGFSKCKMSNMDWNRVSFREANFFKTVLKGIDFTTCWIEGIVLSEGKGELEGMVVNTLQALDFAKSLGIVIQSEKSEKG